MRVHQLGWALGTDHTLDSDSRQLDAAGDTRVSCCQTGEGMVMTWMMQTMGWMGWMVVKVWVAGVMGMVSTLWTITGGSQRIPATPRPTGLRSPPRVILTGGRSPYTLPLIRVLARSGAAVAVAESMALPLSRFSADVSKSFRLPCGPAEDYDLWVESLRAAAREWEADLIIPTCEEAVWLAQAAPVLEKDGVALLVHSDGEEMVGFHSKAGIMDSMEAAGLGAHVPYTCVVDSGRTVVDAIREVADASSAKEVVVAKPEFSRFGTRVRFVDVAHGARDVVEIVHGFAEGGGRHVIQQWIGGRGMCSYSVVWEGRVLAHCAYVPSAVVDTGASATVTSIVHPGIAAFVASWAQAHSYSGQVGFDFIEREEDGRLFVLECNPRTTLGVALLVHTASDRRALVYALLSPLLTLQHNNSIDDDPLVGGAGGAAGIGNEPGVVAGVAGILVGIAIPKAPNMSALLGYLSQVFRIRDVLYDSLDRRPWLFQVVCASEVALRAWTHSMSLAEATTMDIEYSSCPSR